MKPSFNRRFRRRTASHEAVNSNKENKQEQSFFGESPQASFFQPVPVVQRKCEHCEEEEKNIKRKPEQEEEKLMKKGEEKKEDEKLNRKEASAGTAAPVTSSYIHTLHGNGTALPKTAQTFFTNRMGYNFSHVKIHTDATANHSAKEVNAKAYTVGNHIVFNEGQYNTESAEGKQLMAHELVHVVQQSREQAGNRFQRKQHAEQADTKEQLPLVQIEGEGLYTQNTTHQGNCENVSVAGSTDANYGNSFSTSGLPSVAPECDGCSGNECISISGNVVSVFTTNPTVTLPSVPSDLNVCEQAAVRTFINTTLRQHENQHVAAFNTYRGTVRTPYAFTGCQSDLAAYVQTIHDNVEVPRRASSDAASAALDANGANIFTVTCDCPDPVSDTGTE